MQASGAVKRSVTDYFQSAGRKKSKRLTEKNKSTNLIATAMTGKSKTKKHKVWSHSQHDAAIEHLLLLGLKDGSNPTVYHESTVALAFEPHGWPRVPRSERRCCTVS